MTKKTAASKSPAARAAMAPSPRYLAIIEHYGHVYASEPCDTPERACNDAMQIAVDDNGYDADTLGDVTVYTVSAITRYDVEQPTEYKFTKRETRTY